MFTQRKKSCATADAQPDDGETGQEFVMVSLLFILCKMQHEQDSEMREFLLI